MTTEGMGRRVRRRGGGQRRGRDDRRADRRAPRPARGGDREDRPVRRLHRPLRRRHLGARTTRYCAGPASGTPPSRPAPTWPSWRATTSPPARQRALLEHGPAMLAFVRASHPGRLRLGAGLRRLLPRGPRRAGPGAQHRAGAARRPGARGRAGAPQPAYLPAPTGMTITQADYRWLSLGPRHPRAMLASAKVLGRAGPHAPARPAPCSAWARPWRRACGRAWWRSEVPVWLDTPHDRPAGDRRPGHRGRGDPRRPARADRGPAAAWCWPRAASSTTSRCGSATSASRSAPSGRPARPATPATRSSRARPPGRRSTSWTTPGGARPSRCPAGPYFCLAERSLPGCMLVNGAGQRFVNESAPYVDAVHAMYAGHCRRQPAHPVLADHRPALPQQLRVRRPAAAPAAAAPLVRGGRGATARPTIARAGRPGRHRARRPGQDRGQVQRVRRRRPGRGLRPRRLGLRPLLRRPAAPAQPVPGAAGARRRSTPSRSCPATSAPRAACAPTSAPGCCAPTAPRSPGCTRRATPAPR